MPLRPELDGVDSLTANLVRRVCVGDLTTRAASHFRDRTAIVDDDQELTYRELEARSNAVARGLSGLGLTRGDVVAMLMPNSWEFLAAFFACAKIGVICMPVNLGLAAEDVAYQLDDAEPTAVIAEEPFLPLLAAALGATTRRSVRRLVVARGAARRRGRRGRVEPFRRAPRRRHHPVRGDRRGPGCRALPLHLGDDIAAEGGPHQPRRGDDGRVEHLRPGPP
jgi:acyl-CoA synthetase (AMP-forming)/AMP-acid ligase II